MYYLLYIQYRINRLQYSTVRYIRMGGNKWTQRKPMRYRSATKICFCLKLPPFCATCGILLQNCTPDTPWHWCIFPGRGGGVLCSTLWDLETMRDKNLNLQKFTIPLTKRKQKMHRLQTDNPFMGMPHNTCTVFLVGALYKESNSI